VKQPAYLDGAFIACCHGTRRALPSRLPSAPRLVRAPGRPEEPGSTSRGGKPIGLVGGRARPAREPRKTRRNPQKTLWRGRFRKGSGHNCTECNPSHSNYLDPEAHSRTPSRSGRPSRPRTRVTPKGLAKLNQSARNIAPREACPSPIGPRALIGSRLRQGQPIPSHLALAPACQYAVTSRRARAVRGRHPARFPPRPGQFSFFSAKDPRWQ